MTRIGIVAPSAPIGKVELELGSERLRAAGFDLKIHPQVKKRHLFFAGTDEERATGFLDIAMDPNIDVLWCARGGYGAYRLLQEVERRMVGKPKPPHKKILGYSDVTAILDFARERWGWDTVHSPMPGTGEFGRVDEKGLREILATVRGEAFESKHAVKWWGAAPKSPIQAELVGGNLAVWLSLYGTSMQPATVSGKILFLEDVGEGLYRIDRMVRQLEALGGFKGVKALVLGTFSDCDDSVMQVLAERPPLKKSAALKKKPLKTRPLRPRVPQLKGLQSIFGGLGERLSIPVAWGLQVGHGGGYRPLPIGASYELQALDMKRGTLVLKDWSGWSR